MMDEARRFLRYVIPGLTFVVEVMLGLWLVVPHWTQTNVAPLFRSTNSLGSAAGAVLASAVLGYIFGTIHHYLSWHLPHYRSADDRNVAHMIIGRQLSDQCSNNAQDRMIAFQIAGAYWFRMKVKDREAAAAHDYLDSFGDLAHAAGTAFIASCAALGTVVITCAVIAPISTTCADVFRWLGMLVVGLVLCYLFYEAYRRLLRMAFGIFERVVEEEIRNEPLN